MAYRRGRVDNDLHGVLDTTIANVALRYISGGLAVSADEASWVITTYLVSNAINSRGVELYREALLAPAFYLLCLSLTHYPLSAAVFPGILEVSFDLPDDPGFRGWRNGAKSHSQSSPNSFHPPNGARHSRCLALPSLSRL